MQPIGPSCSNPFGLVHPHILNSEESTAGRLGRRIARKGSESEEGGGGEYIGYGPEQAPARCPTDTHSGPATRLPRTTPGRHPHWVPTLARALYPPSAGEAQETSAHGGTTPVGCDVPGVVFLLTVRNAGAVVTLKAPLLHGLMSGMPLSDIPAVRHMLCVETTPARFRIVRQ